MLFKTKDSYPEPAPVELSPNRRAVAEPIAERETLRAERDRIAERLNRLDREAAVIPPLEAELAALNADEAAAMTKWAESGEDVPAPAPDVAKRADIAKRLAAARVAVAAIDSATVGLRSQADRVGVALAEVEKRVEHAVAMVKIDELREVYPRLAEHVAAHQRIMGMFNVGRNGVIAAANGLPDEFGRSILIALEHLDAEVREARAPEVDLEPVSAAWARFSAALADDATATLEHIK